MFLFLYERYVPDTRHPSPIITYSLDAVRSCGIVTVHQLRRDNVTLHPRGSDCHPNRLTKIQQSRHHQPGHRPPADPYPNRLAEAHRSRLFPARPTWPWSAEV